MSSVNTFSVATVVLAVALISSCGKSDSEMADTAVPAMAPGAMDTITKVDTVKRGGMDSTTTRDTLRADTIRRDTTRDTVPR